MPLSHPFLQRIVTVMDFVTYAIYLGVAVALCVVAALSLMDAIALMGVALTAPDRALSIMAILHSLLLTIIIVELLETMIIYFRTSEFRIQPILLAGITAMVRRLLMFGVEIQNPWDIAVTLAAIVVLAAALVYLRKEQRPM
ncbi:MAG: phosphate-starvation-inducible PsiE family protein [Methanomicrobiales archaeon]